MEATDANTISELAMELLENFGWTAICDRSVTVYGLQVQFQSGVTFEALVGAGILDGEFGKLTSDKPFNLTDNIGGGNPRMDRVEIVAISVTEENSNVEVMLTGIVRTSVGSTSLGTGDDVTKRFDLPHAQVDIRTLTMNFDGGDPVGGWNLSAGTGTAGVDEVIFGEAPPAGVDVRAQKFDWHSGGGESSSAVDTRKTYEWAINVLTGTPDVNAIDGGGATAWSASSIRLAEIVVGDGWSGGAPIAVNNAIQRHLVFPDQAIDGTPNTPAVKPFGAKLYSSLRNRTQEVHGLRLVGPNYAINTGTVGITPGFGVVGGISFFSEETFEFTIQGTSPASPYYIDALGWWYVYGQLKTTDNDLAGEMFDIFLSQSPPNSARWLSPNQGTFYIGPVYALAAGSPATIRPFFSHGDWYLWEEVTEIDLTSLPNDPDCDLQDEIPATGKLAYVEVSANALLSGGSTGDWAETTLGSHRQATAKPEPLIRVGSQVFHSGTHPTQRRYGLVRAEESEGSRWVHREIAGDPGTIDINYFDKLYVKGFLDDYRVMGDAGDIIFY